ncbi:hypothetical protein B0O80DRAFT_436446 [Mortierella sp. GBAus27b]|nr:hypothetical protein B0O80DRAFT_436446 [Mortierella sp. GBAus27b]
MHRYAHRPSLPITHTHCFSPSLVAYPKPSTPASNGCPWSKQATQKVPSYGCCWDTEGT